MTAYALGLLQPIPLRVKSVHTKMVSIGVFSDRVSGTLTANAMLDMQMLTLNAPDEQSSIMLTSVPTNRPSIAIMRGNAGMSPISLRAVTTLISPQGTLMYDPMPMLELRSSSTNMPAWSIHFNEIGQLVIEDKSP